MRTLIYKKIIHYQSASKECNKKFLYLILINGTYDPASPHVCLEDKINGLNNHYYPRLGAVPGLFRS